MRIADRTIGRDRAPFVIAELSGNHGGSLDHALATVDAIAASGADALKLQTYTADTMTLDVDRDEFVVTDPESLWFGERLHALYHRAHTPWAWHEPLFARARERGLLAFSSPFDASAIELLESLDVPAYKIASFEINDHELIRDAARTGKPLIVSTGLATVGEIEAAVTVARDAGCDELALLVCTSAYPAPPAEANLATIDHLRRWTGLEVGISDHTEGIGVSVAAAALGASIIEKHVTLDRSVRTVDGDFSLEPAELRALVAEAGRARDAVGAVRYGPGPAEAGSRSFRRSLYFGTDLRAGDRVTREHLRAVRPGFGLPPSRLDDVLGARLEVSVTRGTPVTWEAFRAPHEAAGAGALDRAPSVPTGGGGPTAHADARPGRATEVPRG